MFNDQAVRQAWMECQQGHLLNDQAEEVIEAVEQVTCRTAKKQQNQLLTYLNNNLARMRYKTYRDQGYCIGSGAIEAPHRNVIQKMLKLSGQRWTQKGLQQVANLRTTYLSNQLDKSQNAIRNAA